MMTAAEETNPTAGAETTSFRAGMGVEWSSQWYTLLPVLTSRVEQMDFGGTWDEFSAVDRLVP
jgi:hypothetical protein